MTLLVLFILTLSPQVVAFSLSGDEALYRPVSLNLPASLDTEDKVSSVWRRLHDGLFPWHRMALTCIRRETAHSQLPIWRL